MPRKKKIPRNDLGIPEYEMESLARMLGCKNHEVFAKFTGSAACCKIDTILTQKIHESFAGIHITISFLLENILLIRVFSS